MGADAVRVQILTGAFASWCLAALPLNHPISECSGCINYPSGRNLDPVSLQEIQAAADALPMDEQKLLYAHLAQRLNRSDADGAPNRSRSRRGFPISRGRVQFGNEDVARIEAEADARE